VGAFYGIDNVKSTHPFEILFTLWPMFPERSYNHTPCYLSLVYVCCIYSVFLSNVSLYIRWGICNTLRIVNKLNMHFAMKCNGLGVRCRARGLFDKAVQLIHSTRSILGNIITNSNSTIFHIQARQTRRNIRQGAACL